MSATLAWKLNRLRTMDPAEFGWRIRKAVTTQLEHWGIGLASDVNVDMVTPSRPWIWPLPRDVHAPAYIEAAERILTGRWDVFALRDCQLGFPPQWNRDPKSGIEAPLDFGTDIDYRNEHIVGDIKYLWEPNRHLELVTLAQAWHLTNEIRFAEGARDLLASWFEQCPYPLGPQWSSSLELAVRLVNWASAWHLIGGESSILFAGVDGRIFRRRWLTAVYRHCHFISRHLSRYSSANNHLFGELMGLFVASVIWPLWPESGRWRDMALGEIEAEAVKQNSRDGVNREQAFWYHHEVADMMLLSLLFGRADGIEFSGQFRERFERMLEFIASVMDVAGNVPMVGDSDDAVIIRFSREPNFCPYRSLLASGAVLFGRGDFKVKAGRFDDKTRWLLGDEASAEFDALPVRETPARLDFAEGGYYLFGKDFGSPREIKAIVDAGPLGYLSIAAHGHADALSFTLSVGGREILVDPGTFAYHGQTRWRNYFRGTSAHNTLRVDGMEQSVSGGNFMWLTHAQTRCEHFETNSERDIFEGAHEGYLRLDDPVLHRRRIEFDKQSLKIEVTDTIECAREHYVELHWHFAEHCRVTNSGRSAHVASAGSRIRIVCPPELETPVVVIGQDSPPLGWISRRLDQKTPSPVIVCAGRLACKTRLVTVFAIEDRPSRSH